MGKGVWGQSRGDEGGADGGGGDDGGEHGNEDGGNEEGEYENGGELILNGYRLLQFNDMSVFAHHYLAGQVGSTCGVSQLSESGG